MNMKLIAAIVYGIVAGLHWAIAVAAPAGGTSFMLYIAASLWSFSSAFFTIGYLKQRRGKKAIEKWNAN